jgi:hypothetical protein
MKLWSTAALLCAVAGVPALAQSEQPQSGATPLHRLDDNTAQVQALSREVLSRARAMGLRMRVAAPAATPLPDLEFPLRLRSHSKNIRGNGFGFFIDHDGSQGTKDYMCGQQTYNGHAGVDFVPFPFWWRVMDADEVEAVAAAPGVIVSKHDGEFDKQCHFAFAQANVVAVQQDDGLTAYYFHLKKGSLTTRPVGARVATGDFIGLVGSSGVSYVPHLHFELRDARNAVVEPYFGACNRQDTLWKQQTEDFDTDVLRVATQTSAPKISPGDFCSDPAPGYKDNFKPGDTVFAVAYLRDMQRETPVTVSIVEPDGTVFGTGTSGADSLVNRMSFYYISRKLPRKPTGRWIVRAELEGKTFEHAFMVGKAPTTTTVQASVQPQARSIRTTEVAKFDVTVKNTGPQQALGCVLAPDAPLAAVWHYQAMVRNKAKGPVDEAFDIGAGATAVFQLTFEPKPKFAAYGSTVPVRIVCNNAEGTDSVPGFNVLTLSFEDAATPDVVPELLKALPNDVLKVAASGAPQRVKLTASDLGASGQLTVRAASPVPVDLKICRLLTPTTCAKPPSDSAAVNFRARTAETFRLDVRAKGNIPLDVVNNRIRLEFVDDLGIVRGATSVAVTTD